MWHRSIFNLSGIFITYLILSSIDTLFHYASCDVFMTVAKDVSVPGQWVALAAGLRWEDLEAKSLLGLLESPGTPTTNESWSMLLLD